MRRTSSPSRMLQVVAHHHDAGRALLEVQDLAGFWPF